MAHESIYRKCPEQICSHRKQTSGCQGLWEGGVSDCLTGTGFLSVPGDQKVLVLDRGEGVQHCEYT